MNFVLCKLKLVRKKPFELQRFYYDIADTYGNFKEGDIGFPPTYKFDLRDGNTYAKHRTPSYTVKNLF